MYFCENIAYAPAIYKTEDFLKIDLEYDKFNKFNDWAFMSKISGFGNTILLNSKEWFFVRRHDSQDTWTNTNVPTIQQVINWDLFFKNIIEINKEDIKFLFLILLLTQMTCLQSYLFRKLNQKKKLIQITGEKKNRRNQMFYLFIMIQLRI